MDLREALVEVVKSDNTAMITKFVLDAIKFSDLFGTYISHRLVLPEAVPPVTPMNKGFFVRSNFSSEDSIFLLKVKSFSLVKAETGSSSNSITSAGTRFLST